MTVSLLDANVLIALVVEEHEHHERASRWIASVDGFALCPVVEGALARFLVRMGEAPGTIGTILGAIHRHDRVEFWPDALSYAAVDLAGIRGHRQVTDAYLVALAADRSAALATLDRALAARWPDTALLVGD